MDFIAILVNLLIMEPKKKYESIYQLVNLPNIRHLSNEESKHF